MKTSPIFIIWILLSVARTEPIDDLFKIMRAMVKIQHAVLKATAPDLERDPALPTPSPLRNYGVPVAVYASNRTELPIPSGHFTHTWPPKQPNYASTNAHHHKLLMGRHPVSGHQTHGTSTSYYDHNQEVALAKARMYIHNLEQELGISFQKHGTPMHHHGYNQPHSSVSQKPHAQTPANHPAHSMSQSYTPPLTGEYSNPANTHHITHASQHFTTNGHHKYRRTRFPRELPMFAQPGVDPYATVNEERPPMDMQPHFGPPYDPYGAEGSYMENFGEAFMPYPPPHPTWNQGMMRGHSHPHSVQPTVKPLSTPYIQTSLYPTNQQRLGPPTPRFPTRGAPPLQSQRQMPQQINMHWTKSSYPKQPWPKKKTQTLPLKTPHSGFQIPISYTSKQRTYSLKIGHPHPQMTKRPLTNQPRFQANNRLNSPPPSFSILGKTVNKQSYPLNQRSNQMVPPSVAKRGGTSYRTTTPSTVQNDPFIPDVNQIPALPGEVKVRPTKIERVIPRTPSKDQLAYFRPEYHHQMSMLG